MAERPCGRDDCPIVDPASLDRRRLRRTTWAAGAVRYRGVSAAHARAGFTPVGLGRGRFTPMPDRPHVYLAEQRSAAILESVLHEANGPNPGIYAAQLDRHVVTTVGITVPVRLVDLRDEALADLGVRPEALTDAQPRHYSCTLEVARHLVGAKDTHGFVWTSRQSRLHRERNPDGLAAEVLEHRRIDVAVLYEPGLAGALEVLDVEALATDGRPSRFVQELANLLRIAIL